MRLLLFALLALALHAHAETPYQRHLRAYAMASNDRAPLELLCETYGYKRKAVTSADRNALASCVQREIAQLALIRALTEAQDRDLMYRNLNQPIR